ncbi:MAG TPA: hypothetical protein VJP45_03200 [Candidatus Limnocylindria bacterium]|nr:hypothetical protein [Candidatus Limnocylindria bacterium]
MIATSTQSFDDAIAKGVAVRDGKVSQYRVDLEVAPALEEDKDEEEGDTDREDDGNEG